MSKIGQQVQSGTPQQFRELCGKHPIAIKLLGNGVNLGIADTVRNVASDAKIILRADSGNWDIDNSQFIRDFAANSMRIAEPFLRAELIDFLSSANEPIAQSVDKAKRLNEQQVWLAGEYKRNGFVPTAYAFSVGNPDYPLWPYLSDGVIACDGWTELHEYGVMPMSYDAENLALRHRKARTFMSAEAQRILKVIVGECFMDFGIGRPPDGYPKAGGYRAMPQQGDDENYWIRTLTQQLDWWDGELAKDDYVVMTTGFLFGGNEPWVGLGFDVASVDTDRAFYIAWQRAGKAVIPSPVPPIGEHMQVYQPFAVPPQFVPMGWVATEGKPIAAKPFYRLQPAASFLSGVNVYCQVCVIDQFGRPIVGAKVVTIFPDGSNGAVLTTDAKGCATFNGDANWAFTPPAQPPMLCFIADDSAFKDNDSIPKRVVYKEKWSDEFRYGDTNAEHTQGNVVMALQIVMPDAVSRDDAIRLRAYPVKALTIPVYCAACGLQAYGRANNLGAVLSDEFYVTFGSRTYVCQGFAQKIAAVEKLPNEQYGTTFTVQW